MDLNLTNANATAAETAREYLMEGRSMEWVIGLCRRMGCEVVYTGTTLIVNGEIAWMD